MNRWGREPGAALEQHNWLQIWKEGANLLHPETRQEGWKVRGNNRGAREVWGTEGAVPTGSWPSRAGRVGLLKRPGLRGTQHSPNLVRWVGRWVDGTILLSILQVKRLRSYQISCLLLPKASNTVSMSISTSLFLTKTSPQNARTIYINIWHDCLESPRQFKLNMPKRPSYLCHSHLFLWFFLEICISILLPLLPCLQNIIRH